MNKILNRRICLEKKWSNKCVKHGVPLPIKNGRVLSISPSAYYYHTGVNANGSDIRKYRELSEKAHDGERKEVEEEVFSLIDKRYYCYFFEVKDMLIGVPYDEFNRIIGKPTKKDKYNRVQRLLRKWEQISHKCHYKVTGAIRRINGKNCDV